MEAEIPATREVRKTVSVLFCDLVDSTALAAGLDPEVMRMAVRGFFDLTAAAIDRHGGTVEKYAGDSVMAVFGHPRVREDDALRAVSAALEMRDELAGYSRAVAGRLGARLAFRTGVNTGPVVAGDVSGGHGFVTGDAVNVAARLQQAAAPDEILIGEATYTLAGTAINAEPTGPLALKGKGELLAWSVHGLAAVAPR